MPRKKKTEAPQPKDLGVEEEPVEEPEKTVKPEVSSKSEKPKQAVELSEDSFVEWYNNLEAGETLTVNEIALVFDATEQRIREVMNYVKGKRLPEDLGHIVPS